MPPIDDEVNGTGSGTGSSEGAGTPPSGNPSSETPPSTPDPETRFNTLQSRIDAVDKSLKDISGFMENFSRSQTTQTPPPQESPATEEDDMALLLSDPKAYREKLKQEVSRDVTRSVMGVQESSRMEQELLEEFPDLKDSKSEFWKEVDAEYRNIARRMGREGEVGNVTIARSAAEIVDRRKLKKKLSEQANEPSFPGGGPSGVPPAGGTVRTSSGQNMRITDEHMNMASSLGLTDKDLADVYKNS